MDATVELLHRVARSTVTVAATIPASHPSAAVLGSNRFGSGTAVDSSGLVLTVNYVVLGADSVHVIDVEGRRHDAALVAQDFATGIAVVRIPSNTIAPVSAGSSSSLSAGDDVFLIASAGDGDRRSATGIATALDPFDAYWEYRLERAIWASCSNPGLGGGPVCNARGELIGVTSLNLGNIGRATLAIPSENYFEHSGELISEGRRTSRPRRAWLGMFCYAFADRTVVAGLVPGSPGEHWGLEAGDVIVRIDGEQVMGRSQLYESIWTHDPGEVVELDVFRNGELVTVPVESIDVEEFFDL